MDLHDARVLGRELLDTHGLTDWTFEFDRARTRAGQCRFAERSITVSRHLTALHDSDAVRDTILHEIAHALVGPRHGHDATWRRMAVRVGASPERTLPADALRVAGDWQGRCRAGHEFTRHRRPQRVLLCRRCRGSASERVIDWRYRGVEVPLGRTYERELAAVRAPSGPAATPSGTPSTTPTADAQVPVGARVRVTAAGRYRGVEGVVAKRGRTRYHVTITGGVLTVPFGQVERAG